LVTIMATKIAVQNPQAPDLSAMFPWGLRVRDFQELLLITGHGDLDPSFQVRHPGDPLGQTRAILEELRALLDRAGYSVDDVIKVDVTVTREYDTATNFNAFTAIWAEFFAGSPVKPSGGTLRVIDALVVPGMLVEIEMMAAR
jgi:enamine deaminase RidA (YjgF/YER057c/UK114 family)